MVATTNDTRAVHTPSEVAGWLGITTARLVELLREKRYPFTELRPGGKPGDRGRCRWGLTLAQYEEILRGQSRQMDPRPEPPAGRPAPSPVSPDGKSRLRRARKG